jgi:hypothetical protein
MLLMSGLTTRFFLILIARSAALDAWSVAGEMRMTLIDLVFLGHNEKVVSAY